MEFDAETLAAAVLQLPTPARAALAARLLESLDDEPAGEPGLTDAEWETAWSAECDRRESADPATDVPADEAFRRAHAVLAAGAARRGAAA